jgi:hydroxymethylbilane synthase
LDATVLAAAGLDRLGFRIESNGRLRGPPPTGDGSPQPTAPRGLLAAFLPPEVMLPCVGQAAIGIEIRAQDERSAALCARLNHAETSQCVTAERAFLQAMGGGCQSPVAAHAELIDGRLRLRAVSFRSGQARHATGHGRPEDPIGLGREVAAALMQPEL